MLECAERGEEPREMTVEGHYNKFLETKKGRTREIYRETLKKMLAYGMPRTYNDLNIDWLRGFEGWLGISVNAKAIHLRNIRALVNDAIDNELTTSYPFRKFKIKHEETRKRALSLEQVHMLRDWPVEEYQKGYRDIFILMILMRGINIGDLALLKEDNIVDGRINYRRQKTHELYSIKVEPEMMEIINRYRGKEFLLDICDRYADYGDYMRRMNKGLRKIGELKMKGCKKIIKPLFPDITTYWARHSYATIGMYDCELSIDIIGDLLGHSNGMPVTNIYIRKNERVADEAARKIIDKVMYGK
jgi:integrase